MQTADAVMSFGFKMLILSVVLALLPSSPFVGFVNLMNRVPFLQYVNWFIPIGEIIAVAELWLVAVVFSTLKIVSSAVPTVFPAVSSAAFSDSGSAKVSPDPPSTNFITTGLWSVNS